MRLQTSKFTKSLVYPTTPIPVAVNVSVEDCNSNCWYYSNSSSPRQHEKVDIQAFLYIVVVILFYASSIVLLLIKYARNDDEEVNLKYQYSEFVKRERFQSAQYKNMLALQRTQAVLKNMAPELLTHIGNYPMIIVSDFDREVTMPIDRSDIGHHDSCLCSLKSVSTIVLNENSEGNLSRACLDNDNDIESEAGYNTCTSSPTNQSLNSAVWHVGMNPSVYFDAVERGYRPILIAQSYWPTLGRPRCSSV